MRILLEVILEHIYGSKKYIFKSNVTIDNPEYNVDSEELEYYTESNYTYFNDKTLITGIDYSILCKMVSMIHIVRKGSLEKMQ